MTARRVLIAAPAFRDWDLGTYVDRALHRLGWDTAQFAWHGVVGPGARFERAVRQNRPRFVIGLKLDGIPPASIRAARRAGARVLLWQVDCFTAAVPRWVRPRVAEADAVAITAGGLLDAYRRLTPVPVEWIMEGAYLPAFRARPLPRGAAATYGSEIAFVGNLAQPPVRDAALAGRRMRLLTRLARRFDVRVWGPQRPSAIRAARRAGLVLRRWPTYHDELVRVCQASAIVLGLNTVNSVRHYFSNRTFLTLASGGFHVTAYVPGLEDLFDNHTHLVWFQDDAECVDVCRFYLGRSALRRKIAARGRALVRRRWGLTGQVKQVIALLERADSRPSAGSHRA